jgi:hypothetical protein
MKKNRIQELAADIASGNYSKSIDLFGGANLIILTNQARDDYKNHHVRYPQDVLVFSDDAYEYSWLVYQLQEIFRDAGNSINKSFYYTNIGEIINEGIDKNWTKEVIMMNVIISCLVD